MAATDTQIVISLLQDQVIPALKALSGSGGTDVPAPAPSGPPTPSPSDLASVFTTTWSPLTIAEVEAQLGPHAAPVGGASLPALMLPLTADRLVLYARVGCQTNGNASLPDPSTPAGAKIAAYIAQALVDNAHNVASKWTGSGTGDADTIMYLLYTTPLLAQGIGDPGLGTPASMDLVYLGKTPWSNFIERLNAAAGSPGVVGA